MRMKTNAETNMPPKLDDGSSTERVQIVAPASWLERIEAWRRRQVKIPSKSEAIRILVDQALEAGENELRRREEAESER